MKIQVLLQARMGSTRLPEKVMKPLCGKPVIEHIVDRLKRVKNLSLPPVIMTTVNPLDDVLEAFSRKIGVPCFRGSEENMLDRTIKAVESLGLDAFVRLGADTPFVDRKIIDTLLDLFISAHAEGNRVEYVSNTMERCFPLGLDTEIMTASLLDRIDRETRSLSAEERSLNEENVIPYLHGNLERFNIISYKEAFDHSHLRWTLDTPEDFELTRRIYEALYPENPDFLMADILKLLETHPDWSAINCGVVPRTGFWTTTEKKKLEERLSRKP